MFRLQHLQWLGAGLVATCCLVLGGAAVQTSFHDYQRFDQGLRELRTFVTVLDAANAISAERGPANIAMAATADEKPRAVAALDEKRRETDATLARMANTLADRGAGDALSATDISLVTETLEAGRAAVDDVVAIPLSERNTRQVPEAIMAMFRAADTAATLRSHVSGELVSQTPQIAGDVMLASAASALREQAGRLGSYVVMTLVAPIDEDAHYEQLMDKTHAIVRNIWESGLSNAGQFTGDADISALVARVEAEYLDAAAPMAMETAYSMGPTNAMSGGAFTDIYVPGMSSLEELRTEIVALSLRVLEASSSHARRSILNSAALSLLVVIVLVGVAVVFRHSMFKPLLNVHRQVVALASGDLSKPDRATDAAREVNDIFQGLAILRENLLEKGRLEAKQAELNRKLKHLSETDTLTGLLNRRALVQRVETLFTRADTNSEDIAVALFDIDHFKQVNDTYGHAVGDEVLAGVAATISKMMRPTDAFARLGGEEFVIILRAVTAQEALALVEAVQKRLRKTVVQEALQLRITASFGLSLRRARSGESWDEVFRRVDKHLYAAKHAGRNRIVSDAEGDVTQIRA